VTAWLLDTNVLSELRRPRPEPKVVTFIAAQKLDLLFVSDVTIAEIRFGIEQVTDAVKRAELNDWLAHKLRPMFAQRTLPITEVILLKARLVVEEGRKAGHTFSQPDLIIAATALHHDLTAVTRDTADCARARCPVFNPWTDTAPDASS
jgi:predicted nucleic acid-binding protein